MQDFLSCGISVTLWLVPFHTVYIHLNHGEKGTGVRQMRGIDHKHMNGGMGHEWNH